MYRKRRRNSEEGAEQKEDISVPSIVAFSESLTPVALDPPLASSLELYSVYCSFLRDGYTVEVKPWQTRFHVMVMTKVQGNRPHRPCLREDLCVSYRHRVQPLRQRLSYRLAVITRESLLS